MPASTPWLSRFRAALRCKDLAQARLEIDTAHARDGGLGPGWSEALIDCANAGWVDGCSCLLARGVSFPAPRKAGPFHRARAVLRSRVQRQRQHPSPAAALPPLYALPGGAATAPLSGDQARHLGELLCSPLAPALAPREWIEVWRCDPDLALRLLEQARVAPWAGSSAAQACAQALEGCIREGMGVDGLASAAHADRLMAQLPAGFHKQVPALLKAFAPRLARAVTRSGTPAVQKSPSRESLAFLATRLMALPGVDVRTVDRTLTWAMGEGGFMLALRQQSPEAFAALMTAGLSAWKCRRAPSVRSRDLCDTDVLGLLAQRLATTPQSEIQAKWWVITEIVARQAARERHASVMQNAADGASLAGPAHDRWQALLREVGLDRALPPAPSAAPTHSPTRARM